LFIAAGGSHHAQQLQQLFNGMHAANPRLGQD
jgi:hypothetical protein